MEKEVKPLQQIKGWSELLPGGTVRTGFVAAARALSLQAVGFAGLWMLSCGADMKKYLL